MDTDLIAGAQDEASLAKYNDNDGVPKMLCEGLCHDIHTLRNCTLMEKVGVRECGRIILMYMYDMPF